MTTNNQYQFATIQAWLTERSRADIQPHHIARALGVKRTELNTLLSAEPTVEALLNLNRLAQLRHLALANRVWPNCTWLDWRNRQDESHPVIHLIRSIFGRDLLAYVEETFGRDLVRQYWFDLAVPTEYHDIALDDEAIDPFTDVPDNQMIDNPHCDEEEGGEFFVFGKSETAACFQWLLESRCNYSHYIDNLTSYTNDPLGVQLAYDLRRTLQEHYWASLPPDTLPAWLAIVRMLQVATVPDAYREGALSPLYTDKVATLPTNLLHIVQLGGDEIWLQGRQALTFDGQPVNVFVIEPDTEEAPAALILTTRAEPGNPEHHRATPPLCYLHRGEETDQLALVPRDQMARIVADINEAEEILTDSLWGVNHALHEETGIFCIWRHNPGSFYSSCGNPIPVYRIPGGYMLQFNPAYEFSPQEMAVE